MGPPLTGGRRCAEGTLLGFELADAVFELADPVAQALDLAGCRGRDGGRRR